MAGFRIQCTTTTPGETVTLPTVSGYTYDAIVYWGDGNQSTITAYNDPDITHLYASTGDHVLEIMGSFPAWSVNNTHSSKLQWTGIVYWGDSADFDGWQYLYGGWNGCSNLASLGTGKIISDGLSSLYRTFRLTGIASIQSDIFDNCVNATNAYSVLNSCPNLGSIPDGLLKPLIGCDYFAYAFTNCTLARINPWVFYDDGDQGARFLNKSPNFDSIFSGTGTSLSDNTIPDLWTCDYGSGTPSHAAWITGHSASTLTNYNFIPVSWGGTAFSPSIKPLTGSYVYDGLDVGQSRDFLSKLSTGSYVYDGLDVGQSRDFLSKLLTGSYVYDGLDVGQSRDFISKLLTGSYVYDGLDVGQSRDFISKLLTGSYVYDGLDVGQSRDFISKLLAGSYVYDGLDVNIITPTRGLGPGNYLYSGLALGVTSPYHPMTAIVSWIQGIVGSGIPVILADQNAPVPTGAYLSVRFVTQTSTPDKIADRRRSGSVIRYHMESTDILGVDVKAFVASGATLLRQIELGASDPHSRGVPALIDCGPIYGPAFFNDTHYRPMYHCEFRFRVPASLDTVGSRVQTLGLGGDVDSLEPAVEETFE